MGGVEIRIFYDFSKNEKKIIEIAINNDYIFICGFMGFFFI